MNFSMLPAYDPKHPSSQREPSSPPPPAAPATVVHSSNHNLTNTTAHPPGYTAAPLPNHQLSTRCCCISLQGKDMLSLNHFPKVLVEPVRATILKFWGEIQDEYHCSRYPSNASNVACLQFKLRGYPWQGGGGEGVRARRVICQLMKMMAQRGWNLIQAADVSRHEHNKDVIFFESQVQEDERVVDSTVEMFSVSFNRTDCIRIVDCSKIVPLIRETIQKHWRLGIQNDAVYCGAHEFQLNGNPFYARGAEEVSARLLLCHILSTIRNQGFKLYSSVDLSCGDHEGRDLESWMFRKVGPAWS